jgi:geranylgeranyl pyrophosphate synthase
MFGETRLTGFPEMRKFPPSLEAWRDPIEKTINKTLKANFDRREANQIIKYMFRTGGKRCRPLLVVLSVEALGGNPEEALEAAAAIEIIHAATLVFDDMIDKDQVRRGAPTIHMAFSNEKALTSGLFLASKGVQLLSNYKNSEVMRMIGTTLVDISKGELLDILGDFNASVSECIAIADLKTASLFGTAAGIGAAIAGVDGRDLVGVQKFGRSSGMAFQIQDDILDFTDGSDEPVLKAPNIVTSHCLHEAPRPSSNIELLNSSRKTSNREVLKILKKAGSLEFARSKAKEYAGNAKESLDKVRGIENRKILDDYADYLWKRTE